MAAWTHARASVADALPVPARRPRPRARSRARARTRGGVLWIVGAGILLAGVVFVNVAVLRLNLSLDSATRERAKLRAENAVLQSELSSSLSSSRIRTRAEGLQLESVDPSTFGYVNLAK
jgi:cell division protein FtsL